MPFHALDAQDLAQQMSPLTRLLLRVFRRRLNRELFAPFLGRAHERQVITSHQLHTLHHHLDPTQPGLIGTVSVRRRPRRVRSAPWATRA